jgi:hypothetical protein
MAQASDQRLSKDFWWDELPHGRSSSSSGGVIRPDHLPHITDIAVCNPLMLGDGTAGVGKSRLANQFGNGPIRAAA